jgi:hypothetical protein
MSDDAPKLSPERRAAMRGWVLDYVEKRKRMRRRLVIVGTAAVGVAALSAAAWVVVSSQQTQERAVTCYEAAALEAPASGGERMLGEPVGDPGAFAVDMCASLWQNGIIGHGDTPPPTSGTVSFPVPDLTLCVRSDLSLAVFPTDDASFCEANGLTPYRPR